MWCSRRVLRAVLVALAFAGPACSEEAGLVAHYAFDEGEGTTAGDASGHTNDGALHAAAFVVHGTGHALKFDGGKSWVDCGSGPSLDLREAVSLVLMMKVTAIPPTGEPVVVGKGVNSGYGLTYYKDGVGPTGSRLYFYIGGEWTATPVPLNTWLHVAATFDGGDMALYVNGEEAARKRPQARGIPPAGALVMGKGGFSGELDDVRIYSRALTADEVRAASDQARQVRPAGSVRESEMVHRIAGGAFDVLADAQGGIVVRISEDRYSLASSFSFPGETVGVNTLPARDAGGTPAWTPRILQPAPERLLITAQCGSYRLERTVSVVAGRIAVNDTLTNTAREDVGILVRHDITAEPAPKQILLGGAPVRVLSESPENPTVFLRGEKSRLGAALEDTISRVQMEAATSDGGAGWALSHLGLKSGERVTLRWSLYPASDGDDYFAFINRVRSDWKSNFTVPGPFDFAPHQGIWEDPATLKAYLNRKALRIAAPGSWLDYDNGWLHLGLERQREEYRKTLKAAATALKAADPHIRVIGNIEGPLVSVSPDLSRKLWEALPPDQRGAGYPKVFTAAQLALMQEMPIAQKDSLVRGPQGEMYYELYYRGPEENRIPLVAVLVYPAPGNSQMAFWLDQARFIMEEVGLDGVYLDGGGPVRGARYGYDRWDGVTVDIDPKTGRITRRYTDFMRTIGDAPVRALFDYVLGRGGVMVANGHHYTEEMQSYAIPRILETGGEYDPLATADGQMPPLIPGMCKGHLDAPIALGCHPGNAGETAAREYARFIMKSVVTHLRHGLLYYCYATEIPEIGPGSGEYSPINRMFPITPVELHEGWILGRERIVAARSMEVLWSKAKAPVFHVFNLEGRRVEGGDRCRAARENDRWRIRLELKDWQEIAVVE